MNGWMIMLAGMGGAAGAVVRYAVSRAFAQRGSPLIFATLTVNLAGCFAIGLLNGWQLEGTHPEWYALAGAGFLGGLTTYSTLNVQKAQLAKEGARKLLMIYLMATYPGGLALAGMGLWIGSIFG